VLAGVAAVALLLSVTVLVMRGSGPAARPPSVDIFGQSDVGAWTAGGDTSPVELGTRFTATVPGQVLAIRFYKPASDVGPHTGSLWSATDHRRLARVTFHQESPTGWQIAALSPPVELVAGLSYVVSYHAPAGGYAQSAAWFSRPSTVGPFLLPADAGVYAYGDGGYPASSSRSSAYYVDLVFSPDPGGRTVAPAAGARQAARTSLTGFPDASSTGVAPGATLRQVSGSMVITQPGTVIDHVDVEGGIEIHAENVTVRDSKVRCIGVDDFCVTLDSPGAVVHDVEIGGGANGVTYNDAAIGVWSGGDGPATTHELSRVNVHHVKQGLRVDGATTIEDSYVHQLSYAPGVHSEATFNSSGSNVVFRHNTFVGGNSAVMFIQPDSATTRVSGIVVDDNRLMSETTNGQHPSWALAIIGPKGSTPTSVSDIRVQDNVLDRGPWVVQPVTPAAAWTGWSGNLYSDGAALAQP
jgi:Domain of unknown function (DUF4082)